MDGSDENILGPLCRLTTTGKLPCDDPSLVSNIEWPAAPEREQWLRRLASLGNMHAIGQLGHSLTKVEASDQQFAEGLRYLRNASELGNVRATVDLAWLHLRGRINGADSLREGVKFFTLAAEQGDQFAQVALGVQLL